MLGGNVVTIGADGTGRAVVTTGRDPHWPPGGNRIAYVAETGKDPSEIWTITTGGADPKLLATGRYNGRRRGRRTSFPRLRGGRLTA